MLIFMLMWMLILILMLMLIFYLEVLPVVYPDVSVLARSDEVEAVTTHIQRVDLVICGIKLNPAVVACG